MKSVLTRSILLLLLATMFVVPCGAAVVAKDVSYKASQTGVLGSTKIKTAGMILQEAMKRMRTTTFFDAGSSGGPLQRQVDMIAFLRSMNPSASLKNVQSIAALTQVSQSAYSTMKIDATSQILGASEDVSEALTMQTTTPETIQMLLLSRCHRIQRLGGFAEDQIQTWSQFQGNPQQSRY